MFKSVNSRYVLRAVVAAAIAVSAVASTIWIDNPYVKLISAGVGALATYLGIGAASPHVEPFVGNRMDSPVEVPSPPAVREN